jgi:hypothetical protein
VPKRIIIKIFANIPLVLIADISVRRSKGNLLYEKIIDP